MPQHTVALTGASGFVGRHVLKLLLERGHKVRVLVRNPKKIAATSGDNHIVPVTGGLFNVGSLERLMTGADSVIHLVGIIMEKKAQGQSFHSVHVEGTKNVIKAAQAAGIKKYIHMSALGSRPDAVSQYHKTKWMAEEAVIASELYYTIFRPSLIHGHDGEFMQMVKDFWCLHPWQILAGKFMAAPFVPYFGKGNIFKDGSHALRNALWAANPVVWKPGPIPYVSDAKAGRLQPVHVSDVAHLFVDALDSPKAQGEIYSVGGPDTYTWPELYKLCHSYIPGAKAKAIIAMPPWKAKMIARMSPIHLFNVDQVIMSQENNTCEVAKIRNDFGIALKSFEATLSEYASRI